MTLTIHSTNNLWIHRNHREEGAEHEHMEFGGKCYGATVVLIVQSYENIFITDTNMFINIFIWLAGNILSYSVMYLSVSLIRCNTNNYTRCLQFNLSITSILHYHGQ